MKAYIVGGGSDGTEEYNGVYHLVTEDGVCWATQWCSSFAWARKDLFEDRAGLQEDWGKKYGHVDVLRLGDDGMTFERLVEREGSYTPMQKGQLSDGVYYSIIVVRDGRWEKSEPRPIQKLGDVVINALIESRDQ